MNAPVPSTLWQRFLPFMVVIFAGAFLYGHTLNVPFYLDDVGAIYDNRIVKDLSLAIKEVLSRRGFSLLTFALNYRFGGTEVVGYHLANIVIHLCCACLTLLLLRRIFSGRLLPLAGALLFVAHPLQTQGVTYLVQRMTSLSALFFLLALYFFVLARERLADVASSRDRQHLYWYFAAIISGALAILSKENAVVLPLAMLLFARFFLPGTQEWRPLLLYLSPCLVVPFIAISAYVVVPLLAGDAVNTMGYSRFLISMEGNSPLNYLATQCSVLWIYIRMLFLPYGQALDHGYPISHALFTLQSVAGGAGLIGLGIAAWRLRQRFPTVAFAVSWFYLTLAVESSVIPLDPFFEHRLYLPMFGFSVFVAGLLGRIPDQRWRLGVAVVVLLLLSCATWRRNALWNDPVAFYMSNLAVAPENERVLFNLGQELLKAGRIEEGEFMVRESIARNPGRHLGYLSLKELYLVQGRIDEAIGMLHYGLAHVDGRERGVLYNDLAFFYGKKGDFPSAVEMLQKAIEVDPQIPAAYYNLAQMLVFAGRTGESEYYLRKALELDPDYLDARNMLDELDESPLGR